MNENLSGEWSATFLRWLLSFFGSYWDYGKHIGAKNLGNKFFHRWSNIQAHIPLLSSDGRGVEWQPVVIDHPFYFGLDDAPIEIMTFDKGLISLEFKDDNQVSAGGIRCDLTNKICHFNNCSISPSFPNLDSNILIWRISFDRSSGFRIKIHRNNTQIVNYLFSRKKCDPSWVSTWNRKVQSIYFTQNDTISSYYRPYTGN